MTDKCFFLYRALRRVARKLNKIMNQRRAYDYPSAAPSVVVPSAAVVSVAAFSYCGRFYDRINV